MGMVVRFPKGGGPRFSRLRFTLTLALCTVVVLLSITAWWAERRLSGPLVEYGRLRATYSAQAAINRAVREVVGARLDGADLIRFEPREGGAPVIAYNMGLLNRVMSEAIDAVMEAFADKRPEVVRIPVGELAGMDVLAGWGPSLPIRIVYAGAATAEPKVDFAEAGINQVAHRVYLDVEVRMVIVAPFVREPVVVRQPVIFAEEVFPGDVPAAYVQLVGYSGRLEEWLALQSAWTGAGRRAP